MSTYIPTTIDEKAYEQAKRDALAGYAPQGSALGSGFLAGFVATWLPGAIAIPLLYLYRLAFGSSGWMTAEEKSAAAIEQLMANLSGYSRVALIVGILLGAYGILQAWLRKKSCLTNSYSVFEMARYGEMRLGLDAKLTIFGFPIFAVIGLWLANQLTVLIVAIFLIVISGMVYNMFWQKLHSFFLGLMFRPGFEQHTALALRVMIPRHVGWKKVKLSDVKVNRGEKNVHIEGEFETDTDEKEARNVVAHFLRGYHPIYVVNTRKQAS